MKNAIIITLVIVAVVLGLGLYANNKKAEAPVIDAAAALKVQDGDHVTGDPYADVVLVEYLDFQCPACKAYHALVKEIKTNNKEEIAVVTRHFPLPFHKNAFKASYAAEAAGMQGKFDDMADKLFEGQTDWQNVSDPERFFLVYATELGLDAEKFNTDMNSDAVMKKVEDSRNEGLSIGVNATPTFYLQGQKLMNLKSVEDFQTLIDAAKIQTTAMKGGNKIHEHVDLKMFINNQQINLGLEKYQSTHEKELSPDVHLHDGNGEMIHLHWSGQTVASFFESISMTVTGDCLTTDSGQQYCTGEQGTLSLYADGVKVDTIGQYLLEDLDRILVSYGDPADAPAQMKSVKDEACIYSELCPERGPAPTESCVGGLGTTCE